MSAYPPSLEQPLRQSLESVGDTSPVRSARPVSGGCINHAQRLETGQSVYLLKWNQAPLPGMFACEARGLALLAGTNTVRVPLVIAAREAADSQPAFILLEWLEASGENDFRLLGEQLAALHRSGAPQHRVPAYGLEEDNYLGSTPQHNSWAVDWPAFFAESRIRPQMDLAAHGRLLPAERRARLERLLVRLPDLLGGVARQPALIHGDLWSGNVIPAPGGLALIDPAVSYSDREAEIAYTELFGGFPGRFYQAYENSWPLEPGYTERRDLYNLYHLLNHLNLFGESYGAHVDAVLRHYVG